MMLGAKGILTPLIPDCYVLCTLAIFKNIRNLLIFLRKMATYSCFWRVKRSKILLQASLHRLSDLLTLISSYLTFRHTSIETIAAVHGEVLRKRFTDSKLWPENCNVSWALRWLDFTRRHRKSALPDSLYHNKARSGRADQVRRQSHPPQRLS